MLQKKRAPAMDTVERFSKFPGSIDFLRLICYLVAQATETRDGDLLHPSPLAQAVLSSVAQFPNIGLG